MDKMEEKVVLTEKEKQNAFMQIYKNFWNVLRYTGVKNQKDIEMIRALATNYLCIKHNFAVPVSFVHQIGDGGVYHIEQKTIDINAKVVHASKESLRTIENIEKIFLLLHHEFAHYEDHMAMRVGEKRFVGTRWRSLRKILDGYEAVSQDCYDASKAFYQTARSEVFARQKSYYDTLEFLNNVEKCAIDTIKNVELKKLLTECGFDAAFNRSKKWVSEDTYYVLTAFQTLQIIKCHIEGKMRMDAETIRLYKLKQLHYMPVMKIIFKSEALKFLELAEDNKKYRGLSLGNVMDVLELPGLYDDQVAEAVYQFAKTHKRYGALQRLANFQDYKMSKEEKNKYLNIKVASRKNPIEKIDVRKGYLEYQKRKLNQKDMGKI